MAEQADAEDRTEEPTARKLQKAREDGQIARSVELSAAGVTIGAIAVLVFSGGLLTERLADEIGRAHV